MLNMLEETEAYSAPHKPLCMCVCVCAHVQRAHTHTQKRRQLTPKEVPVISPKGSCCANITLSLLLWNSRFLILTFTHRPLQWCSPLHTAEQGNNTLLDFFLGFRAPSGIWLLDGFSFVLSSCSTSQSTLFFPYVLSTV